MTQTVARLQEELQLVMQKQNSLTSHSSWQQSYTEQQTILNSTMEVNAKLRADLNASQREAECAQKLLWGQSDQIRAAPISTKKHSMPIWFCSCEYLTRFLFYEWKLNLIQKCIWSVFILLVYHSYYRCFGCAVHFKHVSICTFRRRIARWNLWRLVCGKLSRRMSAWPRNRAPWRSSWKTGICVSEWTSKRTKFNSSRKKSPTWKSKLKIRVSSWQWHIRFVNER